MINSQCHAVTARSLVALMVFWMLYGCAPLQVQVHDDDLKLLINNPTVHVVTFKPAPFQVDTSANVALVGGVFGAAGGAIGGALGAAAAQAVANASAEANASADIQSDPRALVRSIVYEDPVKQVRDEFVSALRDELKLSRFVVLEEVLEEKSPEALTQKFHDGMILGFKTEEWVLTLLALSSDYWIRYRASGMLYLPQEKRYIWRELCGFLPKESTSSLSDLAADSGQGLKDLLKDTGMRCAKQLATELLERASELRIRENK